MIIYIYYAIAVITSIFAIFYGNKHDMFVDVNSITDKICHGMIIIFIGCAWPLCIFFTFLAVIGSIPCWINNK